MAHHGVGRGGRGYGYVPSQMEDQKPGISQHEPKVRDLPTDFQSLLLGRGRASPFARGASLFPSMGKQPAVIGRGSFLGASGSVLNMGQAPKVEAGSGRPEGTPVDSNDNVIASLAAPQPSVRPKMSTKPSVSQMVTAREVIPGLAASVQPGEEVKPIIPTVGLTGLSKGMSGVDISDAGPFGPAEEMATPQPSFGLTGILARGETVIPEKPVGKVEERQRTSPRVAQAIPSTLDDLRSLLEGKGSPVKPGLGLSAFGRGSVFMGRGKHVFQAQAKSPGKLAPPLKEKSPVQASLSTPTVGLGLPPRKPPSAAHQMSATPDISSLLASSAGGGRGRGAARSLTLGGLESRASLKPPEMPARHGLGDAVKSEFLMRKPLTTEEPVVTRREIKTEMRPVSDFKVEKRNVVEYHGSSGAKVPIRVNCVRVKCRNEAVYQYHVSFNPEIDNRNMRYNLLNQHREIIGNTRAFDGSILYLPICLKHAETILVSKRITDDKEIQLKVTLTRAVHPASHMLLSFYNVVLHRCMKILKMCPVGRNYYDPSSAQAVPKYKLHLWPGYVTAIREMEGGLLLNIDTSHKVLRNETVLSLMQDIYRGSKENFRTQCIKEILGATVLTRYNNNNYRVDDIDWEMTPRSSFTTSKGETITFFDYYKTQYKIEIKDLNQPMLINRPKKATQRGKRVEAGEERVLSLVPELCFLTGLSERLAGDFTAMKEIGNFTRLGPTERSINIESFLCRVDNSPEAKQELLRWGLELDVKILPTQGRSFPPEKVLVGNNQVFTCNEEVDFFRDISRAPVIRAVPIQSWIIVFTGRDAMKAKEFVKKFEEVSRKIGMQLRPPRFVELRDDRSDAFKNAISSSVNPSLQLVVCIFPTSRDDRYSAVKKLCCVDMPVPSQVILSKTLPRDPSAGKFRSVTMKIALQINCKLGGELWALDIPLSGLMVCGIDVFHEGREGKGKSVAGLVASMNKLMTRWFSRAVIQLPQQEIIDSLKQCFCDTLTKYYEVNHKLPERIVIYRDGVGDGRLPMVAEHEVQQLQDSLKMFDKIAGGKYAPKLTIIVVSKRINIRYFKEAGKNLINPPPGTVLDHTATRPNWPDFYLVSQHVRQGTVSPTHYLAIHGSELLKPDHLQRLTYKLTHMYYNWPGTVRVPAPCQYAHKLAYLVGESIRKEPALDLCNRLFYL